jgi:ATP-binding cassette subfamily C (CFTR/MRP) protein 1
MSYVCRSSYANAGPKLTPCIVTTATGLIIRTAIIDLLFRKSLRISNKARMQHSVGRFMTMISVDCTALETSLVYFHK